MLKLALISISIVVCGLYTCLHTLSLDNGPSTLSSVYVWTNEPISSSSQDHNILDATPINVQLNQLFVGRQPNLTLKISHGVHYRTNFWANTSLVLKCKLLTR